MSLVNELQRIGLSDKEAKVYLATLELAKAPVQKIAQKAGVNRATTYVVLDALIKKGLCSTYEQDKKILYVASNPDTLVAIFEMQKKEIEEKEKNFKKILSDLKLVYNQQEGKPVVRFFEGEKGLFNCMKEFLSAYSGGERIVRLVYNQDMIKGLISEEDRQKYRDVRLKAKVKSRVIYNYKEELKSTTDGERAKVPRGKFPINSDIAIYGDNVRLISLDKNLSAILIQDKNIAITLRTIFDLAWEAAQNKAKDKK